MQAPLSSQAERSGRIIATSLVVVMLLPCVLAGWMVWYLSQLSPAEAREMGQVSRLAPLALAMLLVAAWGSMLRLAVGAAAMLPTLGHHRRLIAAAAALLTSTLLLTRQLLASSPRWGNVDDQMLTLGLTIAGVLLTLGMGALVGYRLACRIETRSR